ncbi:unnamed protein product [Rotaria sp. Silwood1]|nr:unnamed protein product [Rotaria sp. Silwood1]
MSGYKINNDCTSILFLLIHHGQCAMEATADVRLHGTSTSIGILNFVQNDANSPVRITGTLTSLSASSNHGFHVHTNAVAETTPNCVEAAGHFNPYNTAHGPPQADIWHRHVGDLGNITTDASGAAHIDISDNIIQFYNSTQSIANRTIIVHLMFDDGGFGMNESNITGNAGARVACGLIKMINNNDDNFDDIDLDEIFNDFNEKQSSIQRQPLAKYDLNHKTNQDDLFEFNEKDCTAPKINRKRTKTIRKIHAKQMTMYDYASSVSYKHKQFYSSLDNTTTTKTIIKGQKRSLTEYPALSPISKRMKTTEFDNLSSSSTPPDFIDSLLRYLDERSRQKTEHSIKEEKPLNNDEIKTKEN